MPDIKITYLAPLDDDGWALDHPLSVGWDDSEAFVQQMIRGYLSPDPITGERTIYDHGEYIVEDTGARVFFYRDPETGLIVWEDERDNPPTDKACPQCGGAGLIVLVPDPDDVIEQDCTMCGGTGRVVA